MPFDHTPLRCVSDVIWLYILRLNVCLTGLPVLYAVCKLLYFQVEYIASMFMWRHISARPLKSSILGECS